MNGPRPWAVVFAGPSLRPEDLAGFDGAVRGPAGAGAILEAVQRYRPEVIGLVDGLVHSEPGCAHREIRWALGLGIAVYGSSSTGALRAAELGPYGMRGVGQVYEMYAAGFLESDDEVAVVHGPASGGFAAASEALVNMRVTLAAAVQANVISPLVAELGIELMRQTYYPNRGYALLCRLLSERGLAAQAEDLAAWTATAAIDQKRLDACELLAVLMQGKGRHRTLAKTGAIRQPAPFERRY